MATMTVCTFYDGPTTPTNDDDDKLIVEYNDRTQKVFDKDSDVSAEATKVKAIYNACFS